MKTLRYTLYWTMIMTLFAHNIVFASHKSFKKSYLSPRTNIKKSSPFLTFSEKNRENSSSNSSVLTPLHNYLLGKMSIDGLKSLIEEYESGRRSFHQNLINNSSFSPSSWKDYESALVNEAQRLLKGKASLKLEPNASSTEVIFYPSAKIKGEGKSIKVDENSDNESQILSRVRASRMLSQETGVVSNISIPKSKPLKFGDLTRRFSPYANYRVHIIIEQGSVQKVILADGEEKGKTIFSKDEQPTFYPLAEIEKTDNGIEIVENSNHESQIFPRISVSQKLSQQTGVLSNISLTKFGTLKFGTFELYTPYANQLLYIVIEQGSIQKVILADGEEKGKTIFPSKDYLTFYPSAKIKGEGKSIKVDENPDHESQIFYKKNSSQKLSQKTGVVSNINLTKNGTLSFGGLIIQFTSYPNRLLHLIIKQGSVQKVILADGEEKGKTIYPSKDYLTFYPLAEIKGKGESITIDESPDQESQIFHKSSFSKKSSQETGVVSNMYLSKDGMLNFEGDYIGKFSRYANRRVYLEIKNGEVQKVILADGEEKGKIIFPIKNQLTFYPLAEIKGKGKKTRVLQNSDPDQKPKTYTKQNLFQALSEGTGVITNMNTSSAGSLQFGKFRQKFNLHSDRSVYVVIKKGEVQKVILADGEEKGKIIFPVKDQLTFYPLAKVKGEGKETRVLQSSDPDHKPQTIRRNRIYKEFPQGTGVIENMPITKRGNLQFGDTSIQLSEYTERRPYVEIKNGEVQKVVLADGKEKGKVIFSSEDQLTFYPSAEIERTDENLKVTQSSNPENKAKKFSIRKIHEALSGQTGVITNMEIPSYGYLRFGEFKEKFRTYEGRRVYLEIKNGEVQKVILADGEEKGKIIFPKKDQPTFYPSAKVEKTENGIKIVQNTDYKPQFYSRKHIYRALSQETGVVQNIKLTNKGQLQFGKFRKYFYQHEKKMVTLSIQEGQITGIYLKETGQQIYWGSYKTRKEIISSFISENDFKQLVNAFGVEQALRVVFSLIPHDMETVDKRNLMYGLYRYYQPLGSNHNKMNQPKRKLDADLFSLFASLKLFQRVEEGNLSSKNRQRLMATLTQLVYPFILKDEQFLPRLLIEKDREDLSPFLRDIYSTLHEHYQRTASITYKGLRTPMKFFQRQGTTFILDKLHSLLADEPGVGKTLQALAAAINSYDGKGAKRVLIIAPKISKANIWQKQIEEHLLGELPSFIVKSAKQLHSKRRQKELENARFVIINFEQIRGDNNDLLQTLKGMGFDFIIIDEGHRIRNNETLITQAVFQLQAEYQLIVSGTPLIGRDLRKLQPLLKWLVQNTPAWEKWQPLLKDKDSFRRGILSKNGHHVLRTLLSELMIRRLASDVLPELPPLDLQPVYLQMTPNQASSYRIYEREILEGKTPFLRALSRLRDLAMGDFSPDGSNKRDALDNIVRETLIDNKEKLVVFVSRVAWAKNLQTHYQDQGINSKVIHGRVSSDQRDKVIESFNNDNNPSILFITHGTGGESIELSGAHNGVIFDLPWTPQALDQMIRRLQRQGQRHPVNIRMLISKNTLDEHNLTVLEEGRIIQQALFAEFLPDNTEDNILEGLKKLIDHRRQDLEPWLVEKNSEKAYKRKIITQNDDQNFLSSTEDSRVRGVLNSKKGDIIEVSNWSDLFQNGVLSKNSQQIMAKWIYQNLQHDIKNKTPIRRTFLWQLFHSWIPNFEHIDFDLRLEAMVNIAQSILLTLINNPHISVEELQDNLVEVSPSLLQETLYYLDAANIFVFLSSVGLPTNYYQDGTLLTYENHPTLNWGQGRMFYKDPFIIKQIIPNWKPVLQNKSSILKALSHEGVSLTTRQIIRLARELAKGNTSAEEPLMSAAAVTVDKLVGGAYKRVTSRLGKKNLPSDWHDTVTAEALTIIHTAVRQYADNHVYENRNLTTYMTQWPYAAIIGAGFKAAIKNEERRSLDSTIYNDGSRTLGETIADESNQAASDEVHARHHFDFLLKKWNYQERERALLIAVFMEGEDLEVMANQLKLTISEASKVMLHFQGRMKELGPEKLLKLMSGDPIEQDDNDEESFSSEDYHLKILGEPLPKEILSDIHEKARLWKKQSHKNDKRIWIPGLEGQVLSGRIRIVEDMPNEVLAWRLHYSTSSKEVLIAVSPDVPPELYEELVFHEGFEAEMMDTLDPQDSERARKAHILAWARQIEVFRPISSKQKAIERPTKNVPSKRAA